MRRLAMLIVLAVLPALAVGSAAGGAGLRSGIAGRIVEGPTCPVQRVPPDPRCAPRPLQARVRITPTAPNAKAKTVRSGTDGRFRVQLAPGTYEVQGLRTSKSGLPRPPASQRVQVSAGHFTRVTLTYDTGIR